MNGKRKALLIGINYAGTRAELRGCWNDVENMKQFIMRAFSLLPLSLHSPQLRLRLARAAGLTPPPRVCLAGRGYKAEDMVVLTDQSRDPRSIPTRQNMVSPGLEMLTALRLS
jgi:hypothetical protein